MKRSIFLLTLFVTLTPFFNSYSQSNSDLDKFFRLSDFYFNRYVREGLVNYKYANSRLFEIEVMYKLLGNVDLSSASRNQKMAFRINAYNLIVIYQVAKAYPMDNPLDADGLFYKQPHLVAGKSLTLDQLEKEMLVGEFKDPRLHFVLSSAAVSCPELANFAYKPENIETLLQNRTEKTMNDNTFVRVDAANNKVVVSKIFEWYRGDFESQSPSILDFINMYRDQKIPATFSIEFDEYNWQLNERKS